MTRSEARWIKVLGERYNRDLPLSLQIEEYEMEHKAAPAPKNGSQVPAKSPRVLTERDFETIGRAVGGWFKSDIDPRFAALEKRRAELEQGLAKHAGPWRQGRSYRRGEFCTRQGSLWHCRKDYALDVPGTSADWKLVVKRGEVKQ